METPRTSPQTGDAVKIRITAFFVLVLTLIWMKEYFLVIPMFLVIDFGLRAFDLGLYSPLARLSGWLARRLELQQTPVYMPPKRFAARIGLLFCLTILLLQVIGLTSFVPAVILAFFAALESIFGICAGCHVYSLLVAMPFYKSRQAK